MLSPDLTLEKALSQLENPKTFLACGLIPESSLVIVYKRFKKLYAEILEQRLAAPRGIVLAGLDNLHFEKNEQAEKAKQQYEKLNEDFNDLCKEQFYWLMEQFQAVLFGQAPYHHHFFNMILEMLYNAIDHGSDFCELGSVIMEVRIAVNGALCAISQPLPGPPDLISLHEAMRADGMHTRLSLIRKTNETGRGHGLLDATWNFFPMFWFENLGKDGQNGGRAVILETRKRIAEVDEARRKKNKESDRKYLKKYRK